MKKVGIVILTYLNYKDTVECVESLKNQSSTEFEIVLVDNCSPNESFEVLNNKYMDEERIHVIKTEKNLGYAKGNNVGIKYCMKQLKIQNVLVVNNDVIFTDADYIKYLENYPIQQHIGAVGTRIIGAEGLDQNPIYTSISKKRVIKDAVYFTLEKWNITPLYRKIKEMFSKKNDNSDHSQQSDENHGKNDFYFLHGSAIFLTENYLNQLEGFYPKTFLYYEENILAIMMEKLNLSMVFSDEKSIFHKEDQSSALSFGNNSKLINRYLSNSIWSAVRVKFSSVATLKKLVNTD